MMGQIKNGRAVGWNPLNLPASPTLGVGYARQYYPLRAIATRIAGVLMAVSKRLRFEILRRDNHSCRYCGENASPTVNLTIDHVLPTALGGTDLADNLVAACKDCNAGKSASSPDAALVANVSEDSIRWALAVQASFKLALGELEILEQYRDQFLSHWFDGTDGPPDWHIPHLPADWKNSIDTLFKRRLPFNLLTYAADKSLDNPRVKARDKWTYFMGVAWKLVTRVEEDAKENYMAANHGS